MYSIIPTVLSRWGDTIKSANFCLFRRSLEVTRAVYESSHRFNGLSQ